MPPCRTLICQLVVAGSVFLFPGLAHAGPDVTFVLGAMIGDELSDVTQIPGSSLRENFDTAPVYGARVGWSAYPFAVEGSLVLANSELNVAGGDPFDARFVYAEADLQLLLFPGPLSPFLAGGIGFHNLKLETGAEPSETLVGYILGGGIKATIGSVGLRVDLRDHITPVTVEDAEPAFLAALGIADDKTLHNVELSAGLTVRF